MSQGNFKYGKKKIIFLWTFLNCLLEQMIKSQFSDTKISHNKIKIKGLENKFIYLI
jgi:hypothetical protein